MTKQEEKQAEKVAEIISQQLLNMIKEAAETTEIAKLMVPLIIKHFIKNAVEGVLLEFKDLNLTPKAAEEYTLKNFGNFKYEVQKEIASAFELAMKAYSGREDILYHCQISPIREPLNKKPI